MNPWNFRSFLPGRLFLVSLVFAVGATALAYSAIAQKPPQKEGGVEASLSSLTEEKDADGDSLKDWEEILWKTDSKNPDTDGDGTDDGEEVAQGRNPTIKGPNDNLPKDFSQGGTSSSSEELTGTDRVTRALFTEYLLAKSQGKELNEATTKQIVSSVISKSNLLSGKRTYTEGELLVSSDNDIENIQKYGSEMGAIIKKRGTWSGNEVEILTNALEKEDPKKLGALIPIAEGYQNVLNDMLKVRVPSSALPSHLEFINGLSGILFSIKTFQNAFDDPVTALVVLQNYPKEAQTFYQGTKDVKQYFIAQKASFSDKDDALYYILIIDALSQSQEKK